MEAKELKPDEIDPAENVQQQKAEINSESAESLFFKEISNKTFILSSILILIIGLVTTLGLNYLMHGGLKLPFKSSNSFVDNYIPVTRERENLNLEINNPEDESTVYEKNIVISGKTNPKNIVLITSQEQNQAIEADSRGEFSLVFDLTIGLNVINITAFDKKGNEKAEARTIFYSEEKL